MCHESSGSVINPTIGIGGGASVSGSVFDQGFAIENTDRIGAHQAARKTTDWDETEAATGLSRLQTAKVAPMMV